MTGSDDFKRQLAAAAARLGMSPEEYTQRAVMGRVVQERPSSLALRSASTSEMAAAFGEAPETFIRKAVEGAIACDDREFSRMVHNRAVGVKARPLP